MSELAPRVNPITGDVEMVEVDPVTGEAIGEFTGRAVAGESEGARAPVPPLPPLTPAEVADDAGWDPYGDAPVPPAA